MATVTDVYAEYIALIRDGFIPFEEKARELAAANGLPLDPLEAALDEAYSRLFIDYINEVEQGRTSFAQRAYKLAKERNFPTVDIDNALSYAARTRSLLHSSNPDPQAID